MKIIKASNGQDILVDDCYYDYLSQFTWNVYRGYAFSSMGSSGSKSLHKWVALQANLDGEIDHKDRNKLNNQTNNLRLATHSQNTTNVIQASGEYSKYRGVTWYCGKYQAQISVNKKKKYLGRFVNQLEAAKAYDKAAFEHFGEFAILNFPEDYAHLLGN